MIDKLSEIELNEAALEYYMNPVISSLEDLGYELSDYIISTLTYSVVTPFGKLILKLDSAVSGDGEFFMEEDGQLMSLVRFANNEYHIRTDDYQKSLVAEIAETLNRDNSPTMESCLHESIPLSELHNIAWMFGNDQRVDRDIIFVKVDNSVSVQLKVDGDYVVVIPVIAGVEGLNVCFNVDRYDTLQARTVDLIKNKLMELYTESLVRELSELID